VISGFAIMLMCLTASGYSWAALFKADLGIGTITYFACLRCEIYSTASEEVNWKVRAFVLDYHSGSRASAIPVRVHVRCDHWPDILDIVSPSVESN
jgi:hypothetical protein